MLLGLAAAAFADSPPIDAVVLLVNGDATCAGAFVDDRGTIATAYHCVAKGGGVRVETHDHRVTIGRTRSTDPRSDLAIVDAPELAGGPFLPVATDLPAIGARVTVIGHPYGARRPLGWFAGLLRWSVSDGILSGVGETALQVTAPINPGNSGGPVIDEEGRLIGVVSRKMDGDGLGFAARSDRVQHLLDHPRKPTVLGGTLDILVHANLWDGQHGGFSFGARLELSFRDRLVIGIAPNFPLQPNWNAVRYGRTDWLGPEARIGLRQRLFRGAGTTRLDVFGSVASWSRMVGTGDGLRTAFSDDVVPGVGAGVSFAGFTADIAFSPAGTQGWVPRYTVGLRWPGTVSMF
jgi:hypothetical protein